MSTPFQGFLDQEKTISSIHTRSGDGTGSCRMFRSSVMRSWRKRTNGKDKDYEGGKGKSSGSPFFVASATWRNRRNPSPLKARVYRDNTSFIGGMIPVTHVMVRQTGARKNDEADSRTGAANALPAGEAFLGRVGNEHLKQEMEVSIAIGEIVGLRYDAFPKQ